MQALELKSLELWQNVPKLGKGNPLIHMEMKVLATSKKTVPVNHFSSKFLLAQGTFLLERLLRSSLNDDCNHSVFTEAIISELSAVISELSAVISELSAV